MNKRSAERDRALIAKLNQAFGSLILHEITAHRIEQWKRERLNQTWKANGQKGPAKKIQPGTVNWTDYAASSLKRSSGAS